MYSYVVPNVIMLSHDTTVSSDMRSWHIHSRLEVLTAVPMKSGLFWDVTPCTLVKVNDVSDGGR
jgi:hypothetical protein